MLTKLDRRWRKTGSKRSLYRFLQSVWNLYVQCDDPVAVSSHAPEEKNEGYECQYSIQILNMLWQSRSAFYCKQWETGAECYDC